MNSIFIFIKDNIKHSIFLVLGLIFFLRSIFLHQNHDWDIDAFIYLGSRLLNGELIFIDEFETKLPFLQYIFSLAYWAGGIGSWRIITFLTITLNGFIAIKLLIDHFIKSENLSVFFLHRYIFLFFGLFLSLIYSLPGSESAQISMMSASFLFLSLSILICSRKYRMICLSSILFTFSGLIRQHYFYLFPIFCSWFFIECFQINNLKKNLYLLLLYIFTSITVCLLTFAPYFFIDNGVDKLFRSIYAIIEFPGNGEKSILGLLTQQLLNKRTIFFFAIFYMLLISILINFLYGTSKFDKKSKLLFFISIATIVLNYSFIETKYSQHYSILFVPFFSLIFIFSFLFYFKNIKKILVILMFPVFFYPGYWVLKNTIEVLNEKIAFDFNINDRNINKSVLNYLTEVKNNGKTFLVIDNSIYHYILNEKRIGDGHPMILAHVLKKDKINTLPHINLLDRSKNINNCDVLIRSNKDVLLLIDKNQWAFKSLIEGCSDSINKVYEFKNFEKDKNILIWE